MSSTTCRRYDPGDYDRGIDFFRRLYRSSDAVPFWLPQRWEYAEYLVSPLNRNRGYSHDWEETIYLWESSSGEVVGVLCSENPDSDIFVHTMPDYRHLEKEMIEVAEERIVRRTLGLSDIRVWCASGDSFRESLLRSRRYEKTGDIEYLNWRDLAGSVPDLSLPEGHSLHDMVSEYGLDLQHKIDRMTGAFDSPTYPAEIYRNMQRGFSYRKSLDLYSTDSRGNITSFVSPG